MEGTMFIHPVGWLTSGGGDGKPTW